MPAPFTIVTLVDEDGDEFPIRLPGVYPANRGADIEAALKLITEDNTVAPRGNLSVGTVEYSKDVSASREP